MANNVQKSIALVTQSNQMRNFLQFSTTNVKVDLMNTDKSFLIIPELSKSLNLDTKAYTLLVLQQNKTTEIMPLKKAMKMKTRNLNIVNSTVNTYTQRMCHFYQLIMEDSWLII
jgi:hypothetical protein